MHLNEHFTDFIQLLNKNKVQYVLVGGWAVVFQGYNRTTGDIDFFVEVSVENAARIVKVIKEFSGSSLGFVEEDFLKEENVLMLGRPPFRIDILTSIAGVSFDEVYSSSHIYVDEGVEVRCIHINELIRNKKASGRLKDLADAERLEKILRLRNKKK